jgi:hypothetical protein
MTTAEIEARLLALEIISTTALGLYLANSRNDPDYSKAFSLLDFLRQSVAHSAAPVPPDVKIEAAKYMEEVVSILASNLRNMRGEVIRAN